MNTNDQPRDSSPADFLAEFKARPNWLLWRQERRDGKPTKVPYAATGGAGKTNDPRTWTTYEAALAKLESERSYDGIGFVITDGNILVDLDGCLDPSTRTIEAWALEIVSLLNAPTEISPSGRGLHVYVKSQNARSLQRMFSTGQNKRGIEIYAGGRYSAITFHHLPGTPREIPERDLAEFIGRVERGDFDPEDVRHARINESCQRWELDTKRVHAHPAASFDLDRWLATHNVDVLKRKPDGIIIIACPGSHGEYDKGDGRAFVKQLSSGALAMGCLHQTCSLSNANGNRWRQFRELAEGVRARPHPSSRKARSTGGRAPAEAPPRFSEDDLALRLTQRHAEDVRYVAKWGRWLRYDGSCWREDSVLDIFDRCRVICREASDECLNEGKEALAKQLVAATTVAAVQRMATWDQRTAATVDQWDSSIWLLNTPAGAVDPCTGEIRPSLREDYCTKITAVAPGGDCPLWLQFLARITDYDLELERFLQRMVGYCLTGSTREECLFFLYGMGANGKSKFVGAISGTLGDYAKTAPIETFIATSGERHPTDLAGLQGARLVTVIETEQDRRWAESKIKTLTGGDPISARFMRQDFFEYIPQFKLIIAGNHRPSLRSVNEAIRRRFHLVPFNVTIPEAERDLQLAEKLRAEWPGILKWAIEGCVAWYRDGLNPPAVVQEATAAYLANEDHVARWIDDCCRLGEREAAKTQALYKSYCAWCEANNEKPLSSKEFSPELDRKGYAVEHTMYGNVRRGFGLRSEGHEGN
jgi:putative DNA primase/helicase